MPFFGLIAHVVIKNHKILGIGAEAMGDIAEGQRAYAEAGPWHKLGNFMRISVAVCFLVITVVFFATAHDGLISAADLGVEPVQKPHVIAPVPAN